MTMARRFFALLLRALAVGATAAAVVVMVTSHESATVLNLTFEAKYSNTPAFRYFVIAEAIAGGYSALALLLSCNSGLLGRLLLMMDVVIAVLLSSSISAALAIAHVGKKGNSHAGWLPICGQVPKFCDKVTGALIAGFIASVVYLLLVLSSLHSAISHLLIPKP